MYQGQPYARVEQAVLYTDRRLGKLANYNQTDRHLGRKAGTVVQTDIIGMWAGRQGKITLTGI